MTLERKLLITTGSALIALIIAIGAFSLGVYLGANGWNAGAPSAAGPGGKPPRPPDQGALPPGGPDQQPMDAQAQAQTQAQPPASPGQPGPRPQLVGRVRSVSGEAITLDTPQGPRTVQMGPDTQVFRMAQGREEPATADEILPGEHLLVFGHIEGENEKRLVAMRLLLAPPPEKQP